MLRITIEHLKEQLGPTGRFPEGKLNPDDEGEIAIGVAYVEGKVVFDFGKPIRSLGLTPKQAFEIAGLLQRQARRALLDSE